MKIHTGLAILLCFLLGLAGGFAGNARARSGVAEPAEQLDASRARNRTLLTRSFQSAPDPSAPFVSPEMAPGSDSRQETLVPEGDAISDHEARLMLVELLLRSGDRASLARAGEILEAAEENRPRSLKLELYRFRLEAALGNRSKAVSLARDLVRSREPDSGISLEVADTLASLGRYELCRDIYLKVLDGLEGREREETELRFAERALLWGDFYSGERILRHRLSKDPDDPGLNLMLAQNLMAQQRFEEARKHLARVIRQGPGADRRIYFRAWAQKVRAGLQEKDFARAAGDTDEFLARHGMEKGILLPGARAYFSDGRPEDARRLYTQALGKDGLKREAFTGLARMERERDNRDAAMEYLERARALEEHTPLADILFVELADESLSEYVRELIEEEKDPARLSATAEVLAERGEYRLAAAAHEAALEEDPAYFEARMGLARALASMDRYSESLRILEDMRESYPDSHKLELTRGRVLAWSGQYEESLQAYQTIYDKNPDNHIPALEAARTAYWGKRPGQGDGYYRTILDPPVDEILLEKLRELDHPEDSDLFRVAVRDLERNVSADSVHAGYEEFFDWHGEHAGELEEETGEELERLRHELDYLFTIQKRVGLEREAKKLVWQERFAPARRKLRDLVECDPGNQEALFDQAQASCALGLGDEEKDAYKELLNKDPRHRQAALALERRRQRSRPRVFGKYRFWREKGRGDLARMHRHRADLGLEVMLRSRHSLTLTGHRYMESPQKHADSVQASGISLEGKLVTGPYVILAGGVTHKQYSGDLQTKGSRMQKERVGLDDSTQGYFTAKVNLDNYAGLSLGYERREEMANAMALAQGIHSRRYKAGLDLHPHRRLDLGLDYQHLDYSDDNTGSVSRANAGYAFTDHPRRFRTILSGEYRDTSETYDGCQGSNCSIRKDFRHPYWTPEDHWGGAVTFEFVHDLASESFCGAREHRYQLELTLGTEKDQNHSVEIRGSWSREFENGLGANAGVMWHESREWDAASLELGLFYRF